MFGTKIFRDSRDGNDKNIHALVFLKSLKCWKSMYTAEYNRVLITEVEANCEGIKWTERTMEFEVEMKQKVKGGQ